MLAKHYNFKNAQLDQKPLKINHKNMKQPVETRND